MSTSIKAFAFAMIARRTPSMPIVYADAPGSINQSKKKKKKRNPQVLTEEDTTLIEYEYHHKLVG